MTTGPLRPRGGRFGRQLGAAAVLLLILLLPALRAGARLDAPPSPAELDILAAAVDGDVRAAGGEVARRFFSTMLPLALPATAEPAALAAAVSQARLIQVAALFAIAAALYFAVLQARGRLQALLSCAWLAVLPPVANEGHLLRAETPALLFGLLGLLVLQGMAMVNARSPRGARWQRVGALLASGAVGALALGLAVTALPWRPVLLLLPGLVMLLGAAQLSLRAFWLRRRLAWLELPIHAINRRLWPWTLAALMVPGITALLLQVSLPQGDSTLAATTSAVDLWPAQPLQWPVQALALLGCVAAVWRVGLRFGRGGRLQADTVLLAYCGLLLAAAAFRPPAADALPAAPALAVVLGEAVFAGLALLAYRHHRRRVHRRT